VRDGRAAGRAVVPDVLSVRLAVGAGLDPEQQDAVHRLTSGGEMVAVVIAPAGAGKTTALGAAAAAWKAAGYDVLGLAPSACAAAELSTAIGAPADTVAKWCYEPPRIRLLPPEQARRWRAGPRTVLLVDEAAMLATEDLAVLTAAAVVGRAKLVLVGDPAQLGPVERAGGLLPALASRAGSIQLTGIRRFRQPWEAHATRALRDGNPAILRRYAERDRIHPEPDVAAALDAVHNRWRAATATGLDALMMARSRADVEALNRRARAAAIAAGAVRGPVLARAGGRDWRAGDLLRTRRNDRRLPLGDTHVRNRDRFRVIGAGPGGGLLVDDLVGRGRALLPAGYLARHADYGWASTIDGAQGATADVGILLARTGLDREHLYVGMTRGRQSNHVHVTTESSDQEAAHRPGPPGSPPTIDDAVRVLQTATLRVGGQQAAHTLLDQTRREAMLVPPGRPRDAAAPTPTPPQEPAPWVSPLEQPTHRWDHLAVPPPTPPPGRSLEL
jgi:ATP-dependent exoDNAse (exonuclease V) alpha subunit